MSSHDQGGTLRQRVPIVVATSVLLTFISHWGASAIILNDLGGSAFYAVGIAEQAVGKAAPWFIVAVMLFSFAVRAVYVESCSMFVRGGVYRVVKEALGGRLAKLSVSALMFDYILTGPVSGVSAGQYITGLANDLLTAGYNHHLIPWHATQAPQLPVNWTSVVLAVAMTIYFWWLNIKGIEESSEKAERIMWLTTAMVVVILSWSGLTLLLRPGVHLPPWPFPRNLHFPAEALGFWKNSNIPRMFGLVGIIMAFGHSVLAMSGEETLAQVYREIASPKLKNLKKTALFVAVYSFLFTGLVSVLAVMLIPDAVRLPQYKDNLIGGLAMYVAGPLVLRILLHAFVVVVGFLLLSGGINTAIVGSNGVLNRVSEDGVLPEWFRKPQKKYGTTYRIINTIVILQVAIILASRGDVYVLGEAYAFGVMWSFTFKSVSMLVLRFKYKRERGWKVPVNVTLFGKEIPIGLACISAVLLSTTLINVFTKSVATVSGLIFSAVFFAVFEATERVSLRKLAEVEHEMRDQFQIEPRETVERETVHARPGNILIAVRDINTMLHLKWILDRADTREQDLIVTSVRHLHFEAGDTEPALDHIFTDYEQSLFTRAVAIAEKYGKHVSLLVVPTNDVWRAIVQTANALESSAVVVGMSVNIRPQEQAFRFGRAWEALPKPKQPFLLHIVRRDMKVDTFTIGPHAPNLKSEIVQLVHQLWLHITRERDLDKLHHAEIVEEAVTRFAHDYTGGKRDEILRDLRDRVLRKRPRPAPVLEFLDAEERRKHPPLPPPAEKVS